jgi:hypothetical protein
MLVHPSYPRQLTGCVKHLLPCILGKPWCPQGSPWSRRAPWSIVLWGITAKASRYQAFRVHATPALSLRFTPALSLRLSTPRFAQLRAADLKASWVCLSPQGCCMQVPLLPSRIHVSGLDDIWHMSSSLNTGNVVTIDTTDLSLPTDLVV